MAGWGIGDGEFQSVREGLAGWSGWHHLLLLICSILRWWAFGRWYGVEEEEHEGRGRVSELFVTRRGEEFLKGVEAQTMYGISCELLLKSALDAIARSFVTHVGIARALTKANAV
jgi:hypothetical protein